MRLRGWQYACSPLFRAEFPQPPCIKGIFEAIRSRGNASNRWQYANFEERSDKYVDRWGSRIVSASTERKRERERLRGRERDRPCNIEGPEITRYLGAANVYRNTPIFSVGAYFFHLSTRVCSLPPQESGTIRVGSVVTIRRLANMNY